MTKHGQARTRTVTIPWSRIGAALPALALIGGGVALTTVSHESQSASAASASSPVLEVPERVLSGHATPQLSPAQVAKGLGIAKGTRSTSSTPVVLDSHGIPAQALSAYRRAAALVRGTDPGCHLDWALIAAIGKVESDHARFGGSHLDAQGIATPGIIGVALDGTRGTALVKDTDNGRFDQDPIYDHAVGPMQFIPSTWRSVGTDADADGFKNPQSMADSAAATGAYLCAGGTDLSQPSDLYFAILRYNNSDAYAQTVEAIAEAYRNDVNELPASFLPAAFADRPQGPPPAGQPGHATPTIPHFTQKSTAPNQAPSSTKPDAPSSPSSPSPSSSTTPDRSPSPSPSSTTGGGGHGGIFPPIFGAKSTSSGSPTTTAASPASSAPLTTGDLPLPTPTGSCASRSLLQASLCNPV